MSPHKHLLKLILPLSNNIVTKVGIKLMNHLSDNRRILDTVDPQPLLFNIFRMSVALKLSNFMGLSRINPWVMYFSKRLSFSNSKK